MIETIICTKCGEEKSSTPEYFEFKSNGKRSGRICVSCKRAYRREWGQQNRDYLREYRTSTLEHRRDIKRAWDEANVEHRREYRTSNTDRINERRRAHYAAHPETYARHRADWYRNNHEQARACARYRYQNDPGKKLRKNVGTAIWRSLRDGKSGRGWESLVGFDLATLRNHLESKFEPGMGWSNYGEWHVDHVRPVASFADVGNPMSTGFRDCWALENLQPLWASDNYSKGARWSA